MSRMDETIISKEGYVWEKQPSNILHYRCRRHGEHDVDIVFYEPFGWTITYYQFTRFYIAYYNCNIIIPIIKTMSTFLKNHNIHEPTKHITLDIGKLLLKISNEQHAVIL